jgi:hypothetical protein
MTEKTPQSQADKQQLLAASRATEDTPAATVGRIREADEVPDIQIPLWVTDKFDPATLLTIHVDVWQRTYDKWGFNFDREGRREWIQRTLPNLVAKVSAAFPENPRSILDQWYDLFHEGELRTEELAPRSLEFLLGKLKTYGAWFRNELMELEPVPQENLSLLTCIDPDRRMTGMEYRGPIWLANRIFENMQRDQLGITLVGTRHNYFAYRSGKSALEIQLHALVSELMVRAGLTKRRFDMRYDLVFQHDFARFRRFFNDHTPYWAWGIDEISELLHRRTWNKPDQQKIVLYWPEKPKEKQPVICAGPSIFRLDTELWPAVMLYVQVEPPKRTDPPGTPRRAIVYELAGGEMNETTKQWGNEIARLRFMDIPASWRVLYDLCLQFTRDNWQEPDWSPLDDELDKTDGEFGKAMLQQASTQEYIVAEKQRTGEALSLPRIRHVA